MKLSFTRNFLRYFYTIRYLKFIQLYYQLFYRVKRLVYVKPSESNVNLLKYPYRVIINPRFIISPTSYLGNNKFIFLNITHDFDSIMDWNTMTYGKLWNYNLQYLDFINQEKISQSDSIRLIHSLRNAINTGIVVNEPYPASLRIMNLVKFCLPQPQKDEQAVLFLIEQIHYLKNNLEYHLLGNHLLENGFALFIGGNFIKDNSMVDKGKNVLKKELHRQILKDGAHIELSPMYHSIILTRLLDCINLLNHDPETSQNEFSLFLIEKVSFMLGWLKKIQFKNGDIPHLNDSTDGISPTSKEIFEYAGRLNISFTEIKLKESGYRKLETERYEIVIDVGNILPAYQPGHAHADISSFIVNIDDKSFITDSGTSTYQKDEIRFYERSTSAHNTVTLNEQNSSDVWGAFRVGKRSKIIDLVETSDSISCKHDGYSDLGVIHERKFIINDKILIIDRLNIVNNRVNRLKSKSAYFHFHPSVEVEIENNYEVKTSLAKIVFENSEGIKLHPYNYALGFNKRVISKCIEIQFNQSLTTSIIPNF